MRKKERALEAAAAAQASSLGQWIIIANASDRLRSCLTAASRNDKQVCGRRALSVRLRTKLRAAYLKTSNPTTVLAHVHKS